MTIDRDAIAKLIPHSGTMCLLDAVLVWDDASICCRSARHRAQDNPLRQAGRLGAFSGIEFAAQVMAAHSQLAGATGERPRVGFIANLRDVICDCDRLDLLDDDLVINATRLMGDSECVIYAFAITCGTRQVVTGRATVVLQAEMPP